MPSFSMALDALSVTDIVLLSVLVLSGVWGLVRGVAAELAGVLSWGGAILLTVSFHGFLVPFLSRWLHDPDLLAWASGVVVFIALLLSLTALLRRIALLARGVLSAGLDALLGVVFGVVRGYVVLVALFLLGEWFSGMWMASLMRNSVVAPYIVQGAERAEAYLPASLRGYVPPVQPRRGPVL